MIEWVRALSPIAAALLAIGGAALITARVTDRYELRPKQREFDLETMKELAFLYGQVFSVWKAWDAACRFPQSEGS